MLVKAGRTGKRLTVAALVPLALTLAPGLHGVAGATPRFAAGAGAPGVSSVRPPAATAFRVTVILSGSKLSHAFTPAGSGASVRREEALSKPDDITVLGDDLFVGFQNGVGPQGEPSSDGNTASTVVELSETGRALAQWDVVGKCDGLTAWPEEHAVIATVNEDAHPSIYEIHPSATTKAAQVQHFAYSAPLPHFGGTDSIADYHGALLVSASAPGTTGAPAPRAAYPAVYVVTLNPYNGMATAAPMFYDEDTATVANAGTRHGKSVKLALTDPDSSEVVPAGARFGGDFVLDSQGDLEQIYVQSAGTTSQKLTVLSLSQSVDDTAWPTSSSGRLFSTDSTHSTVDVVTGPFRAGQPLAVATPCGANSAPGTCPAPPKYPADYLASLNASTGAAAPVHTVGAPYVPQGGLAFVRG